MARRLGIKDLRRLIREAEEESQEVSSLRDAENVTRLSTNSVDNQIDSMIIKFESESLMDPVADALSEALSSHNLSALLFEQDAGEEDEDQDPVGDADADADADTDADDDEDEESEGIDESLPPLDVDAFTKKIARLAISYDVLLDVKTAVVNRAIDFLLENYSQGQVDEFKEILDEQFDFNLSGPPETPEAPLAVGAGGPGGGLGGGGG